MKSNETAVAVKGPEIEALEELAELVQKFVSGMKEELSAADQATLEKIAEAQVTTRVAFETGRVSSDNTLALFRNVTRIRQLATTETEVKSTTPGLVVTAPMISDPMVRRDIAKLANQIAKLKPVIVGEIHARDAFRVELETAKFAAIESAYRDRDLAPIMKAIEHQLSAKRKNGQLEAWRFEVINHLCHALHFAWTAKKLENAEIEGLLTAMPTLGPALEEYLAQGPRKAA